MQHPHYFGPLNRPQRADIHQQQQSQSIDNSSSSDSDSVNNNEASWVWPNQNYVREKMKNKDNTDPSKISWESLYDHTAHNQQASVEWSPGHGVVECLLFLFYKKKGSTVTEATLQDVIYLLLSLQDHGVIDPTYPLPYSAKTIVRMQEHIPQVPFCMCFFVIVIVIM